MIKYKNLITAGTVVGCITIMASAAMPEPTARPDQLSLAALMAEVQTSEKQFNTMFPNPADLGDADKRAASGDRGIELLRRILVNIDTVETKRPETKRRLALDYDTYQAMLAALGDGPTKADLARRADGTDKADAVHAQVILIRSQWYEAGNDEARQAKVVDRVEEADKAHSDVQLLTGQSINMSASAATPALAKRLVSAALAMKNPAASAYAAFYAEEAKFKADYENKPMILSGKMPDGKAFTTADWKGKVILVDFWASWCAPCKAEMPRVKSIYDKYHAKGLEVLGVSNDFDVQKLTDYTAGNGMPWPQLVDADAAAVQDWNPITLGYGIHNIPWMFVIDQQGICRSVIARDHFEDLISKLIDG